MRVIRALVVLGLLLAIGSFAGPSSAKPERLQVSQDGQSWHDNLATPLFADAPPLVPTDALTRSFHVRNSSNAPARATVAIVNRSRPVSTLQHHLRVSARLNGLTTSTPFDTVNSRRCKALVTGPTLDPGETRQVDVDVAFDNVDGQTAQESAARLDLVVTLRQVGPKGSVDICGVQAEAEPTCATRNQANVALLGGSATTEDCPVAGSLPETGAPRHAAALLGLSVSMMLLGSLLVLFRRRRPADMTCQTLGRL